MKWVGLIFNYLAASILGIVAYVLFAVLVWWVYSSYFDGLGFIGLLVMPIANSYVASLSVSCVAKSLKIHFVSNLTVSIYIAAVLMVRFACYQDGDWILLVYMFISFLASLSFSIFRPRYDD